jgi:Zinc dependent phospholipase C
MIIFSACCVIVLVVTSPEPALAWGPVTHVALGMQVLATVITPEHPLQATLLKLPEIFLYGGLAPDIVQGRRLQSRLRRHSHNWNTGFGLLGSARTPEQQALAWGYLAHLAADVVAHNYFLPARFIGRFESGIASHLYAEARYDTFQAHEYQELLVKLLRVDFGVLNRTLKQAIDSPLFSFSAHQRIFEGGLRRIREFNGLVRRLGGPDEDEVGDFGLFSHASCAAVGGILGNAEGAPACRFDPMGEAIIRDALDLRRKLQRLARIDAGARRMARQMSSTMVDEMRGHLRQRPFAS